MGNIPENSLIVIGAGPAGIFTAGNAAAMGMDVLLLEKMEIPGRKLRITGKGRCNITNTAPLDAFLKEISPQPAFLRSAFSQFFADDLIAFLESIGIPVIEERGGRVFPTSQNAVELTERLLNWALGMGVKLMTKSSVRKVLTSNGAVSGVQLDSGKILNAKKVIIATGGKSYPATGSTGDGYTLAKECGHTIVQPLPALVPLTTAGNVAQSLQGLSLRNVQVNVWMENKCVGNEFGELLFTHFGLSGPVVLTLSRQFISEIMSGSKLVFSIDLKPALNDETLEKRILNDLDENGKKHFGNLLKAYLPGKLADVAPELLSIPSSKPSNQISAEERKRFRNWLKAFDFEITGCRGFKEAIITRGGIPLNEISQKTMESKKCKGLFFAGEVIDLDANTGGYNLQIAFSTAWAAAMSASSFS